MSEDKKNDKEPLNYDVVTDQAVLAKLAINAKDHTVRYNAVKKITVPTWLFRVAFNAKDDTVRYLAVEKLKKMRKYSSYLKYLD